MTASSIPKNVTQKKAPLLIGAHTSAAGGAYKALIEGQRIGANTIQLFTANQRRWDSKLIEAKEIDLWNRTIETTGISHVMSHDSYLINLGSPDPEGLQKSREAFRKEIQRCLQLGLTYLNFHPGAALKEDRQVCLDHIAESLCLMEDLLEESSEGTLRLLLETTAGQGSSVGNRFEEIAYIIKKVEKRIPIGVCIDTCHIFVAGYDLCTAQACDLTLKEFDRVIGLKHLHAFHLNDSVKGLGSRVDRHRAIGEGAIGLECFKYLMQDPRTQHLPKYLETPGGPSLWENEIPLLHSFAKN